MPYRNERMYNVAKWSILPATVLALGGCDAGTPKAEYKLEPAEIYSRFADGTTLEAPVMLNDVVVSGRETMFEERISHDTLVVAAGAPIDVTTRAFGVIDDRAGASEVTLTPSRATILVRNENYQGIIRLVLTMFPRTDRVTFTEVGLAEVVVKGMEKNMQTAMMEPREMRFPVKVVAR